MNRERGLAGVNSYARELGFDPAAWLVERLAQDESAAWLDLCCGRGRALLEAAALFAAQGLSQRVSLVGVDLAGMFDPAPAPPAGPRLVEASALAWSPEQRLDLVTCVHGLHYLGDKLCLLNRAASWLAPGGLFAAHFDPANLQLAGPAPQGAVLRALRDAGFSYHRGRRLLEARGGHVRPLEYAYAGADADAGPNYTGQPAVTSYYSRVSVSAAPP